MKIPEYPHARSPGFIAAQLQRNSHWRDDPERLARHRPDAGVIPVWRYKLPMAGARVQLLPASEFGDELDDAIWLGMWQQRSIYALDISAREAPLIPGVAFGDLRMAAMQLDADDAAVLAYARAMIYWQRQHRHCGRCGRPTRATQAGHVRRCDACEVEHYPRSDPSMLVLVIAGDRCLLGRQAGWPPKMWSVLAGFVEPGESIEDAVVREVWEETRIEVTGMCYVASQPWPFPASVLMGFHASGVPAAPQVEQDELEAADWFSRAEIARGLSAGQIFVPPPFTLSYRVLEGWYDQDAETPLGTLLERSGAWKLRRTPRGR